MSNANHQYILIDGVEPARYRRQAGMSDVRNIVAQYRPEARLILRCCRGDPAAKEEIAGTHFDWEWFERAVLHHQVAPQVASSFARSCVTNAHPVLDGIVRRYHANVLRNLHRVQELKRVAAAFTEASVPMIAVKGPILGLMAYGDPAARIFADLDLLVRERDLGCAAALLRRLGYESDNCDLSAIASGRFNVVEAEFHNHLRSVLIDLHWRLSPAHYAFGPDGDELWERAVKVDLDGAEVTALQREDLLIYLCVHSSRHGWAALSYLCDLARLAQSNPQLDWEVIAERARITGAQRMLQVGVLLAGDLIGGEFPPALVLAARNDSRSVALANSIAAALFEFPGNRRMARREFAIASRAIATARGRWRYRAVHLFAPTILDWVYCKLPTSLYPVYYLIRPLRIAHAYLNSFKSSGS